MLKLKEIYNLLLKTLILNLFIEIYILNKSQLLIAKLSIIK
jgi:hypothetical protein